MEKGREYIESTIVTLINGGKLDNPNDNSSTFNMVFEEDNSIEQLIKFYENSDENIRGIIEKIVNGIDVEKIVSEVNNVCKIDDVSILWVKAVLNYRRITILKGLESVKIVNDVAHKPNVTFSKRK